MKRPKKKPDFVANNSSFLPPIRYLVFAGNAMEAEYWANQNSIPGSRYIYIHSERQMRGLLPEENQIVFCEGYSRNPRYHKFGLLQVANLFISRKFESYVKPIPRAERTTPNVRMIWV